MEAPIAELVREFVQEVRLADIVSEGDVFLQGLIDDFQSGSALFKRDMRHMLEKDPLTFLPSACRRLKDSAAGPGAAYLMELLWSNPVLMGSLIDPNGTRSRRPSCSRSAGCAAAQFRL